MADEERESGAAKRGAAEEPEHLASTPSGEETPGVAGDEEHRSHDNDNPAP